MKSSAGIRIRMEAYDRVGLLRDTTMLVSEERVNIASVVTEENIEKRLPCSVTASAGAPDCCAWSSSSPILHAPSSSEYSVCRCRCTNSVDMARRLEEVGVRLPSHCCLLTSDFVFYSHSIVEGGLLLMS